MSKYQRIHNLIKLDYIELLNITENFKTSEKEFNSLFRASLKSLFSLIEADIFGLNKLDPYPKYSDRESFINKFKKTFIQICKTWNKTEIQMEYFENKLDELNELKDKRNELIHPKEIKHIHKATNFEFEKLKRVFYDYDDFINKLMDDFFISIEIKAF